VDSIATAPFPEPEHPATRAAWALQIQARV